MRLRNCGVAVAGTLLRLRKCFFKLRNCDCGLEKKLHVPTSAHYWGMVPVFAVYRLQRTTRPPKCLHLIQYFTNWDLTHVRVQVWGEINNKCDSVLHKKLKQLLAIPIFVLRHITIPWNKLVGTAQAALLPQVCLLHSGAFWCRDNFLTWAVGRELVSGHWPEN